MSLNTMTALVGVWGLESQRVHPRFWWYFCKDLGNISRVQESYPILLDQAMASSQVSLCFLGPATPSSHTPPTKHTLAHSRARCLVRLALRSSAYKAPMKEPIDVPPTRSTGTPASSNAFSTPICEQPLRNGRDPVTS